MLDREAVVDLFVQKVISRKFLVWLVATLLMLIGAFMKFPILKSEDWVMICAIYIGGQTIIDAVSLMKGNKVNNGITTFVQNITNPIQEKIKKDKETEKDTSQDRPKTFAGLS